jgi:hypothetical protein
MRFPVLPEIMIQVTEDYREPGRHSGGAKPPERQRFKKFPAGALFHPAFQVCNCSDFFFRKSFLISGAEVVHY